MARAFLFRAASGVTAAALIAAAPASSAPTAVAGTSQPQAATSAPGDSDKICKYVVTAEPGSKPFQLCQSKAAWAAKEKLDAQDATRIECHYVEKTGSRFESAKVCMTAAEWENARQADRQWIDWAQRQSCVAGGGC